MRREVGPARIGLELGVAGHLVEGGARLVEAGRAGVAAAGDVERGQVERQADQVVAQRVGDEFVDLVADLARHAAHDLAHRDVRIDRAVLVEGDRVEEGLDQADVLLVHVAVDARHGLVEHRVAEAVHDVGEFRHDGRVDVGRIREHEGIDARLHGAREFLEHHVLVLHLVDEAAGLEQALAVPHEGRQVGRHRLDVDQQPFVDEGQVAAGEDGVLVLLDQAVVLVVEDGVDGGQADVLVAAAVAVDEVAVEQLVVIGADRLRPAIGDAVVVGHQLHPRRHRVVVVVVGAGRGGMRDVVEEGVVGAHGVGRQRHAQAAVGARIAFDQSGGGDDLDEAVRAADEFAVAVGRQQRHVEDVGVAQLDAQQLGGLLLHFGPVAGSVGAVEQASGSQRLAVHHRVLAQEDLVRRVRGIGLVLVDEGGRGVDLGAQVVVGGAELAVGTGADAILGARHHHEIGRAARDIQRVVLLQRNEDGAATLADQVEPVVEELAEQRHHAVERRRQADVGRLVRDQERAVGRHLNRVQAGIGRDVGAVLGGDDRRRVVIGLVDDQVRNDARLRIEDHVARCDGLVAGTGDGRIAAQDIGGDAFRIVPLPGDQARHGVVGRAHAFHARQQAVPGAVDRAQAVGQQGAADVVAQLVAVDAAVGIGAVFCNLDLVEDKQEVVEIDVEVVLRVVSHVAFP